MKKLSKEAKFNLKNGFGSLVSNRCAIEAGKSMPVWLTFIMGILGPALAMVPIIVNVANTNGAAAFGDGINYNLDRNLAITMVDLYNKNTTLEVKDHLLTYYDNGTAVTTPGIVEMDKYVNSISNQYEVRTYFLTETTEKTVNALYQDISADEFIIGTTTLKSAEDDPKTKYYKPMIIAFYKDGFAFTTYKADTTTSATAYAGDFVNTKDTELVTRIGKVNNIMPTNYIEISVPSYLEGLKINTRELLNESYLETKSRTFLYTSTIYFSVFIGLVILLGFFIFFLTRGKRNFNNYLKWYQCLGIACWACVSPGILALGLGFVMQSMALMIFILLMGVRTMWLTMKQLSPAISGK